MKKEGSFLKGAAILSLAAIVIKILGAIYRIPLSNLIKSEGMGYYQTAYPFYTLLLTVSTAGFPVAIAKIVSEKRSIGDYRAANKVFKVALIALAGFGVVSSAYLTLNARNIVENIQNPKAFYALIALAPALVFVPVMSVFRGYFQGSQNMVPTAISQIAEQFFRVVFGLSLTYFLLPRGVEVAAGGASMGGTIGAVAGTFAIVTVYLKKKPEINKEINLSPETDNYSAKDILKDLLVIAIPITLGAAIIPIMDYIDLKLVLKRLQTINFTEAMANDLYGNFKGMAQTLINLPQVFAVALSMSLVPAISNSKAGESKEKTKSIIESGIKVTLLIGLPSALGLFTLSRPIIQLLYYKNSLETIISTGKILRVLSLGVVFLTLVQSLSAILQGLGKPLIPAINLFIGAILKAILTYILVGIEWINIYGAAFSTVIAFATAAILNIIYISKFEAYNLNIWKLIKKPLFSSLGMALVVSLSYKILISFLSNSFSTLISILIGGIFYLVLLLVTGAISKEELKLLPKGGKIINMLEKVRYKLGLKEGD